LFWESFSKEREISVSEMRSGSKFTQEGTATSVGVEPGPDVASTLHTHPSSGVALFSGNTEVMKGDVYTFFGGRYAADTSHSVLGLKWPNASRVLMLEGLEPELDVVKTTVKQGNVVNGSWSQVKISF
jgi:hypothetical protein